MIKDQDVLLALFNIGSIHIADRNRSVLMQDVPMLSRELVARMERERLIVARKTRYDPIVLAPLGELVVKHGLKVRAGGKVEEVFEDRSCGARQKNGVGCSIVPIDWMIVQSCAVIVGEDTRSSIRIVDLCRRHLYSIRSSPMAMRFGTARDWRPLLSGGGAVLRYAFLDTLPDECGRRRIRIDWTKATGFKTYRLHTDVPDDLFRLIGAQNYELYHDQDVAAE